MSTKKQRAGVAKSFRSLPSTCIQLDTDEVVYFEYREKDDEIAYGSASNLGLVRFGGIPYDHDSSLEQNLQKLYNTIESTYGT